MSWIGVDFGAKRVGIAVSQSGTISTPLRVVDRTRGMQNLIDSILAVADEYERSVDPDSRSVRVSSRSPLIMWRTIVSV